MRLLKLFILFFCIPLIACNNSDETPVSPTPSNPVVAEPEPPYWGTIFIDPDIITEDDPTTFVSLEYIGRGEKIMYDRRVTNWITVNAFLFQVIYDDNQNTVIQINPEFETLEAAQKEAEKYAPIIGQLPTTLRRDVDEIWIHKGKELFGGGNRSILIHTEQTTEYERDGILEETLMHEASHTSLDADHAQSAEWLESQKEDGNFISTYAKDNPNREDIAESFLTYLAIRYRADRITQSMSDTITQTIPNRIKYFDNQNFNMYPIGD